MKKDKEGISVITVAVSIVVMIIILTIIVISTNSIIENTRKKQFNREISLVKSSLDKYISRNSGKIVYSNTVEINIADISENEIDQFSSETAFDGKIILKVIDLNEINVENITFGNGKEGIKDRYLVSLSTGKIYYEKGLTIGKNTYYTISE